MVRCKREQLTLIDNFPGGKNGVLKSLGDMGSMLTNMTVGNNSLANSTASATSPAAAASTANGLETLAANGTAAKGAAVAMAPEIKTIKSEKEDTLVMDTKLKIIEILQVCTFQDDIRKPMLSEISFQSF